MKHLTTSEKIKAGSRFVSRSLDDSRIEPYIGESEQMNIKHQIGEPLFVDIMDYVNAEDKTAFADYSLLIDGGAYEDAKGNKRSFAGLVQTLNYYVWARIVKNNNYTVTRFGTVNKADSHSENAQLSERLVLEKDTLSIADTYLSECIGYLKANKDKFPLFEKGVQRNRLNINIIGE